jgi:hypothetical protein
MTPTFIKGKTQRQYAAEGKARESAAAAARQRQCYDSNETFAEAFCRGLLGGIRSAPLVATADAKEWLEDYIAKHGLKGDLLRKAFNAVIAERAH